MGNHGGQKQVEHFKSAEREAQTRIYNQQKYPSEGEIDIL